MILQNYLFEGGKRIELRKEKIFFEFCFENFF